jgi:hypothetical protein
MDFEGDQDEQKMAHVVFLTIWPFFRQKPKY